MGPESGPRGPGRSVPDPERTRPQEQPKSEEQKESVMQTKLSTEVRQSLSLLAMTAVTLIASIGLGILAGQLG